ncbi:hypothetical protein ABL78_6253 [Leptomonas seymouri]|uniref:Mitochondrial RNA binding complex 1 subunit n=1 Tax=Leptomonas seymouri TaxID=5684 RepID=A0A0N1IJ19_LEPSE|nr:hypothetical protein ABL78_6253 [Leptomonas seymouri]|eukprot:KPI84684.1 hypothetical protein ABL78_6253 [Leptomonas seymouri]
MRRCAAHGLTWSSGLALSDLTALHVSQRTPVSIGGRASRTGFSEPPGKAPRVKQGTSRDIPQRIPGTTKVRYTNNKGRTFTFSIPVSQLTHPPVHRRGAAAAGWHEVDTSFSDVGDLEDDMPTELDERLAAVGVVSSGEGSDNMVVEVNAEQLRGLQSALVQLCREYVLMDTNGMKTSMSYGELSNGPDYEHYDRKVRRRRHWIALRRRFEDVRELLWPSDAAAEMHECGKSGEMSAPLLSLSAMMEALSWLEAASTFAIRKHRPYDTAAATEFAPLDLSREVRVVAECLSVVGPSGLVLGHTRHSAGEREGLMPMTASSGEEAEENRRRAATDRFISFAALCANHKVPLKVAFSSSSSSHASSGVKRSDDSSNSVAAAAQAWLSSLPALTRLKDALRVMAVLQSIDGTCADTLSSKASQMLRFSNEKGVVERAELLGALCRLVSTSLFPHAAALENVDEGELCVLMRFVAELQEQNAAFLQACGASDGTSDVHTPEREVLQHLTQLAITRCRQLLYKTDGPTASLLSGDEENIPLVDLQAFAEHSHPAVRVHTKIGEANALGLRYARLQSPSSAILAQLLSRIEEADRRLATSTHSLRTDLLQHIAHRAALGKAKLSLEDVTRALSLLADLMLQTSERQVKAAFDRLFSAMSTSIGVGLQQVSTKTIVLDLFEGLARCHYEPSSYKALEVVTLRLMMRGFFSLEEAARALVAMLQIVGPQGVSQSVQQAIAMRVASALEKSDDAAVGSEAKVNQCEVWSVLRALRFSLYPSFTSLMLLVAQSSMTANAHGWTPEDHVRYAVLLAAAAGRLTPWAEDAEVVQLLSTKAREELELGLRTSVEGFPCVGEGKEDAYQECLVTCAALQLETTPPVLTAWACASRGMGKEQRQLHSLCTPQLAVSTLEAMEALHLASSQWYAAYDAYLVRALQQMLNAKASGRASQYGLLNDDAQTMERTLYLSRVSPAARAAATALLEREVEHLDAVLTGGLATDSTSAAGRTDVLPVFTFQQKTLSWQAERAAMEERLLRYCTALRQRGTETETAEPNSL